MTQKLLIDNTKRAAYLIFAGSIFFSVSILICHGTFTLEENQVKCSITIKGETICHRLDKKVNCYSLELCKLRRTVVIYSLMAFLLGLGCILMIFIEISLKFEFNRWTMFYKKIRLFILILALVLLAELNFGCMSRMSEDDNVLYYYVAGSFQIGGSLTFVIASTLLTYNIFKEMSLKNDLKNEYLLN